MKLYDNKDFKIFKHCEAEYWPYRLWSFHVEPQWNGGTKIHSDGPGHMTKMAIMPIYSYNPLKIFSRTSGPMTFKLGDLGLTKFIQIMILG